MLHPTAQPILVFIRCASIRDFRTAPAILRHTFIKVALLGICMRKELVSALLQVRMPSQLVSINRIANPVAGNLRHLTDGGLRLATQRGAALWEDLIG